MKTNVRRLSVPTACMAAGALIFLSGSDAPNPTDRSEPVAKEEAENQARPSTCPEGTTASAGWSGEYPSPVIQVNANVTVKGRGHPCDATSEISCTVPAGLYHPWSTTSKAAFQSVAPAFRFVTRKEVAPTGRTLPVGTHVLEQSYLSEGFCVLVIDGKTEEGDCPGGAVDDAYTKLPTPNADFGYHQFLEVACTEGVKSWLRDKDLLAQRGVTQGQITDYGVVAPIDVRDESPAVPGE
jgi:hypothetical protein